MTDTMLTLDSPQRGIVRAGLTFASVPQLWRELRTSGALQTVEVADLAAVTESDSAGLALLVAWRAARRAAGGNLRFESVPERLHALARLTDAETLLGD